MAKAKPKAKPKAEPNRRVKQRRKKPNESVKPVSVALRPETIAALKKRLEHSEISTSAYVERAITSFLKTDTGWVQIGLTPKDGDE